MPKPKALVIGGAFTGIFVARDLKKNFDVTVVDAKEYFEYTPGVLRAFVKPSHYYKLSFTLQTVLERSMGVNFLWGEVKSLDGVGKKAVVQPMSREGTEELTFDYCVICAGCNFGPFHKWGESLWFPTIHQEARAEGSWAHIDERFYEGRMRHILEENQKLKDLEAKRANLLVVGAGFIGVEWVTELQHYFPNLNLTIIDFLPRCLGPLPDSAAKYCDDYMVSKGINTVYGVKYDPNSQAFWDQIGLPNKADFQYVCIGVKASNYFMPKETLSDKGPGGGGWILMNQHLQVTTKDGKVWGDGSIFAVGDCNFGCVETPGKAMDDWLMPPVPKISYPGEEQAMHAVQNIKRMQGGSCGPKRSLVSTWWPWGAGMFATSLGPHDACFVVAANHKKNSGYMVNWWWPAALQKEIIEISKVDECAEGWVGWAIWHFVHHTPCHLWGKGCKCCCF